MLNNIFYPPKTIDHHVLSYWPYKMLPSNLSSNIPILLPKFTDIEDAYLFQRKFDEICSMMYYPNVPINTMQLKVIPLL